MKLTWCGNLLFYAIEVSFGADEHCVSDHGRRSHAAGVQLVASENLEHFTCGDYGKVAAFGREIKASISMDGRSRVLTFAAEAFGPMDFARGGIGTGYHAFVRGHEEKAVQ